MLQFAFINYSYIKIFFHIFLIQNFIISLTFILFPVFFYHILLNFIIKIHLTILLFIFIYLLISILLIIRIFLLIFYPILLFILNPFFYYLFLSMHYINSPLMILFLSLYRHHSIVMLIFLFEPILHYDLYVIQINNSILKNNFLHNQNNINIAIMLYYNHLIDDLIIILHYFLNFYNLSMFYLLFSYFF
jgi:hypothetical protein